MVPATLFEKINSETSVVNICLREHSGREITVLGNIAIKRTEVRG